MKQFQYLICLILIGLAVQTAGLVYAGDQPDQAKLVIKDHPFDGGDKLDVSIELSENLYDSLTSKKPNSTIILKQSEEDGGLYQEIAKFPPNDGSWKLDEETRTASIQISGLSLKSEYFYRLYWKQGDEKKELIAETTQSLQAKREWFLGDKWKLAGVGILICGSVIFFIEVAKRGWKLKVRRIAGLEAVDEAVGRATEMGRSVLFVPGIQDMNDIQTIAGLNILSHVAQTAAEYDAKVEVPTSRALVMTAARETLQGSYLAAGRPDAYNPDLAYYVTDDQFGYVAYVSGMMVREKPAACFYLGAFFAESLILAETGNSVGAIQVAGTAQPSQLPFFVAACDYTLIGEELFAASAYLSGSPEELGSLKGQDVGKIIVAVWLLGGCAIATLTVWGIL